VLGTSLLWRSTVAFTYLNIKSTKCLIYSIASGPAVPSARLHTATAISSLSVIPLSVFSSVVMIYTTCRTSLLPDSHRPRQYTAHSPLITTDIMLPPLIGGGVKLWCCLASVCLQRCYQDQGVRDQDQDQDQDQQGRDQDQEQDLKKVVLIGLETKTRFRDMYAMLLYKSSKS